MLESHGLILISHNKDTLFCNCLLSDDKVQYLRDGNLLEIIAALYEKAM